ncbi:hypothetical protein [Enterobacter ludwigii]|uniref:hypothetical protein n=1 Tax=Enterobacter ludwigii TaxID=299767 RepID=UPI00163AE015|nr:hypothetical protein [Enterobacter ludwigii]
MTSEKFIIAKFPEARRKGVSVLPRQAGQERGEKTVINLFYYSTFFIFVSQICAENRRDPELVIFGSQEEKRETDAEKGTNGVRLLRLGDYCCLGKKLHFINSFQQ